MTEPASTTTLSPPGAKRLLALRGGLAWETAGTLALNVATTVLNFALALVLARLLGVGGYGAYSFALAWSLVLCTLAGLGLSPLVIRHVASALAQCDWATMRGILRWSNAMVAVASLAAVGLAAALGVWLLDDELLAPFLVGLVLVPATALTMLRQSAMVGLGRVVLGRAPETLVMPGAFLLLALAIGVSLNGALSATWAISLQALATVTALGLGMAILARSLPAEVRGAVPRYDGSAWARRTVPLFLFGLVSVINGQLGTILLGVLSDAEDTGVFAVALKLSTFTSFLFLAATYPLMPAVARLHALGEHAATRATLMRATRLVVLATLPVAVAIVVLAGPLLGVFGTEFEAGTTAVRILVAGEVVKVALGFAGLALVMTGHEGDLTRGVVVGTAVNLLLALALVPELGADGAAAAAATGTLAANLVFASLSRRRLGFAPTPLGR